MIPVTMSARGLILAVRAQPRSSRNALAGIHGNELKIKLTAPPVDGEANRLLLKFLAKTLGLPRSSLEIISGETGRSKKILITCPENAHDDILLRLQPD